MIIDNESLYSFRRDFDLAMAALQEKYDATITLGQITYSDSHFTAKLTVNGSRDQETNERAEFDRNVWKFEHLGLYPGMYNRIFKGGNGKRYAITGFRTRAKKHPIDITDILTGERRVCNESFIKELLNEYYVASTEGRS